MPQSRPPSRLPQEHLGSPGVVRVVGLVAALVVSVVVANLAAAEFLRSRTANHAYRILDAKYELLDHTAGPRPVDWLILGDSSGAHGINPSVWTTVTGGTALNLAIVADLLVNNDVWMLRDYIARVGVPKNVVLVHAFDVWNRGYDSVLLGKVPRPWGYWEQPPRIRVLPEHQHRIAISRYLPLYAETGALRSALERHFAGNPHRFLMNPLGWVLPRARNPGSVARDTARGIAHVKSRGGTFISEHNKRALMVLAWYADKYDINVYIAHSPTAAAMAATPEFPAFVKKLDAGIAKRTARSSRVHILPEVFAPHDRHLERTTDHPNRGAVAAYTLFVAAHVMDVQRRAQEAAPEDAPSEEAMPKEGEP